MTVIGDLCAEPLSVEHGIPLGIEGYAGYRFAVEIGITSAANLLPFILGTGQLGGPRWRDITPDVQGITWTRGGEPNQRPIAGELSVRLLNTDCATWSPWLSPWYGPGTILRVVIGNGVDTLPQFTGLVQSWNEGSVGLQAYEWVDIRVWEPLYLLSLVNDNALAGVVGGGDTLGQRIDRLLTQADWQFDAAIFDATGATFQATDLAQDTATEMYLTVDSVDYTVWTMKDGSLKVSSREWGSHYWTLAHNDQNPDSLITANDDERILSSVDLARVGGTSVTYTNAGLASIYQRRSTNRNDLITVAESADADLERVANGMLARARQTYRPISIEIQSGYGSAVAEIIIESDLMDRMTLDHETVLFDSYAICGFTHNVQLAATGVYWTTTISLDIESDSNWVKYP